LPTPAFIPDHSARIELLDQPETITGDLAANLRDIRILNRWTGGTSALARALYPTLHGRRSIRILDVATGSADIPLHMLRHASQRGIRIHIVGLDSSPGILAVARDLSGGSVELMQGDARSLPLPAASFDIVTCCLALHHFNPDEAIQVLREMWRVSRDRVVVADLTRSYPALIGAWLSTHTIARNRVTRHDALLSVRRAYTPPELAALAERAALENIRVRRYPFFRQALTASRA